MLRMQMIGHIGADAVIRDYNGRKAVSFSIAHNEKYKDAEGTKHERTQWASCTIWRESASKLAEYLTKGTTVYVEGDPTIDVYRNREGASTAGLSLRVTKLEFVNGSTRPAAPGETSEQEQAPADGDDLDW